MPGVFCTIVGAVNPYDESYASHQLVHNTEVLSWAAAKLLGSTQKEAIKVVAQEDLVSRAIETAEDMGSYVDNVCVASHLDSWDQKVQVVFPVNSLGMKNCNATSLPSIFVYLTTLRRWVVAIPLPSLDI